MMKCSLYCSPSYSCRSWQVSAVAKFSSPAPWTTSSYTSLTTEHRGLWPFLQIILMARDLTRSCGGWRSTGQQLAGIGKTTLKHLPTKIIIIKYEYKLFSKNCFIKLISRSFGSLLFYLEACESGSMFEGLLAKGAPSSCHLRSQLISPLYPDLGVLAVTASNSSSPSFAAYYDERSVWGSSFSRSSGWSSRQQY